MLRGDYGNSGHGNYYKKKYQHAEVRGSQLEQEEKEDEWANEGYG